MRSTQAGTYLHLLEQRSGTWYQQGDPSALYSCLQLIYGVGPRFSSALQAEGYTDLRKLIEHPRWGGQAARLVQAIQASDVAYLSRRGAAEAHLLGYFTHSDTVFLDLETTGLTPARPLFLVGLLSLREGKLTFDQYLARCFEEERAAVGAAVAYLAQFRVWVSFNGRAFDIPYLRTRAEYYGINFPQPELHIDLLRTSRRLYRDLLPNCRLTTLESYLLNRVRFDDVPGHLIPDLYHQFVAQQQPELLLGVLRHNVDDLLTLSQLMHLVQEEQQLREQAG